MRRVQACGHKSVLPERRVDVKIGNGTAAYAGLSSCGSVWVCPWCSAKVATERAAVLQGGIGRWMEAGNQVGSLTLTVQHNRGDQLAELWDGLSAALRSVQQGKAWVSFKERHGLAGHVRVVEHTYGDSNGWHPHVHAVLFFEGSRHGGSGPACRSCRHDSCKALRLTAEIEPWIFARWARALERLCRCSTSGPVCASRAESRRTDCGHDSCVPISKTCRGKICGGFKAVRKSWSGESVGAHFKLCTPAHAEEMGQYVSKFVYDPGSDPSHLALEAGRGDLKEGRKGNRTPWQILEDTIADKDDRRSLALWREWEQASYGRRQYGWTKGMKELLGIVDRTDEEIAADDMGGELVASMDKATWKRLQKDIRVIVNRRSTDVPIMLGLLHAGELHGDAGLFAFAAEHDIDLAKPAAFAPPLRERRATMEAKTTPAAAGGEVIRITSSGPVIAWDASSSERQAKRRARTNLALPRRARFTHEIDWTDPHTCQRCGDPMALAAGEAWESVDYATGEIISGVGSGYHPACLLSAADDLAAVSG